MKVACSTSGLVILGFDSSSLAVDFRHVYKGEIRKVNGITVSHWVQNRISSMTHSSDFLYRPQSLNWGQLDPMEPIFFKSNID